MGYDIPKEIKYSFIAITKEALNNVMRHSNANEVKILAREHPGLYQLIIEDNGTLDERIRPNGDREEYAEKEVLEDRKRLEDRKYRKQRNRDREYEKTCPHAWRNHADPERNWLSDIYYGSQK